MWRACTVACAALPAAAQRAQRGYLARTPGVHKETLSPELFAAMEAAAWPAPDTVPTAPSKGGRMNSGTARDTFVGDTRSARGLCGPPRARGRGAGGARSVARAADKFAAARHTLSGGLCAVVCGVHTPRPTEGKLCLCS